MSDDLDLPAVALVPTRAPPTTTLGDILIPSAEDEVLEALRWSRVTAELEEQRRRAERKGASSSAPPPSES